ncbi:hypothetical protein O1K_12871 [Xanthomonas fragariae LMG 25863]|nr:hypothetical protein O1K_12871 [Xanthomonas fragariae LMG 25863]
MRKDGMHACKIVAGWRIAIDQDRSFQFRYAWSAPEVCFLMFGDALNYGLFDLFGIPRLLLVLMPFGIKTAVEFPRVEFRPIFRAFEEALNVRRDLLSAKRGAHVASPFPWLAAQR